MALINFGALDTRIPAEMGAAPANMLAQIRQQRMHDEDRAVQREGQQMQNALARMKIEGAQAESARSARWNNELAGRKNWRESLPELRQVDPERAMELEKRLDELDGGRAERRAKLSKVAHDKLGMYREQLIHVNTPQQFAQWITAQHNDPDLQEIVPSLPSLEDSLATIPQDPREFERMKVQSALGIGKFIEMNKPSIEAVDLGGSRQFVQTMPLTGEVRNVGGPMPKTMSPGEIAADARARATLAQGERHFQATQGLQRDRLVLDRSKIKAEHGTPSAPKLTEGQAKAQLFGSRAAEADRIITDLEEKVSPIGLALQRGAEGVWGVGGALGAVGNSMLSPEAQQLGQAKRDFINAVLRLESGATIQEEEFNNAEKQYFPQPGDSKAVIEQKRRNRQTAIQGLGVMAGPAGGRVQPQSAPAATEQNRNIVVDW